MHPSVNLCDTRKANRSYRSHQHSHTHTHTRGHGSWTHQLYSLGVNGVIIRYTPHSHPPCSNAVQHNKEWQASSHSYVLNSQGFDHQPVWDNDWWTRRFAERDAEWHANRWNLIRLQESTVTNFNTITCHTNQVTPL